jgi:hypothetical protein
LIAPAIAVPMVMAAGPQMYSSVPARAGRSDGTSRYAVGQEPEGTWRILDTMTGLPAATNGRDLVGLQEIDALEIAAELNRCEESGCPSPLL